MRRIPIMFCFNNNYCIPAATCFISIMEHASKSCDYHFYVLHSDITDEHQQMLLDDMKRFKNCHLEFVDMNNKYEEEYNKIQNHSHFSKELLYKLSCATIFDKEEKIIITDVDVVFLGDIAKMYDAFETNEDFYYAGISGIKTKKPSIYRGDLYNKFTENEKEKLEDGVGAGFLLMNLSKIRNDKKETEMMTFLMDNSDRLIQIEQDVINITCYKHIKKMPHYYMVCSYEYDSYMTESDYDMIKDPTDIDIEKYALENPLQLHYATPIKPWKYTDCTKSEIWFEYFNKSVFSEKYLNTIKKNKKSVNSFFVRFMKTKTYSFLLKIYHFVKKILKK